MIGFIGGLLLGFVLSSLVDPLTRRAVRRAKSSFVPVAALLVHVVVDLLLFLLLFHAPLAMTGCAAGLLLQIIVRTVRVARSVRATGGETNHG